MNIACIALYLLITRSKEKHINCTNTCHKCHYTHNWHVFIVSCYKYGIKLLSIWHAVKMDLHKTLFFYSYGISLLTIAN